MWRRLWWPFGKTFVSGVCDSCCAHDDLFCNQRVCNFWQFLYLKAACCAVSCCAAAFRPQLDHSREPFFCHLAVQSIQALLCLQGREMKWESAAGISALVRYAPCKISFCTNLLLWSHISVSQAPEVCKAMVLMLAATLPALPSLSCYPAPCLTCRTASNS